jgi:hypothetical protein
MQLAFQVLVLVHLIGFAALLGGVLAQSRDVDPEINVPMLYGALIELVSGIALWILAGMGSEPVDVAQSIVKTLVTVFVTVVVVLNRKYASIPRGLAVLIGGLTVLNAALAVFWQ